MDFPRAEKMKSEPLLPALGPCCSAGLEGWGSPPRYPCPPLLPGMRDGVRIPSWAGSFREGVWNRNKPAVPW